MRRRDWLGATTRVAVADLVRAIEARTSAEVVVTVRARSADYRHVDLAIGAAVGFAAVLAYVFLPVTFNDDVAPIAIAACFAAGTFTSRAVDAVRRPFVGRGQRRAAVRAAARVAFVDQEIARTRSRKGLLVYVSIFEREVEVVPDIGVDVSGMGPAWSQAVVALETVARRASTSTEVLGALRALGDALAVAMPIGADDVNELPDEVPG